MLAAASIFEPDWPVLYLCAMFFVSSVQLLPLYQLTVVILIDSQKIQDVLLAVFSGRWSALSVQITVRPDSLNRQS